MRTASSLASLVLFLDLALSPAARGAEARQDCAAALQPPALGFDHRPVTAEDLVRLRDIGANFDIPVWAGSVPADPKAIALSPGGTSLAFEMRRANPASNSLCLGIYVINLRPGARPILIDEGGDLIRLRYDFRGKAGYPSGLILDRLPRWTSDGRAVFFLKQMEGTVQVWRAEADGSGSRPITRSPDDVVDFRIEGDGRSIVYKTQPGLRTGLKAIEAEGLDGFRYDDRFSPMASNRPFVPGPLAYQTRVQTDAPGAEIRQASSSQEALFGWDPAAPHDALATASSRRGDSAWLAIDGQHYPPQMRLWARLANGRTFACSSSNCADHISDLWWISDGRLRFIRREGWDHEATSIYEWRPGRTTPRRILLTDDVLASCVPDPAGVICLREASLRPRYIARIDLPSGREAEIFDPNPEFRVLQLGQAERLHWRNAQGLEAFGDLVLPVGYQPGKRYPLIVVQYESRGFLRGGTGDEYPIQLFAAHGFAVLSFNRPTNFGATVDARTLAEAQRANDKDYADRRSVQSSLETGIKLLVDRGIVDPNRMGITGLSDGASTVNYALINTRLFKAAAFSSCCWDSSLAISVGPGSMTTFADRYPSVLSDSDPIWDPVSIAKNAAHLDVPMLLQISDGEMLGALTAFTALRDHHQPADMYVFPGEYHVKWQPAHRLAIYRRSLAWFQFWLGTDGPIEAPHDELARWEALRRERAAREASINAPANDQSTLPPPAIQAAGPDLRPSPGDHR
jgi:dipeptidyl aminopeptidase/acylaminoacyl peptidase